MLSLEECLNKIASLPEKEVKILKEHFQTVTYPAKSIIVTNKRENKKFYFISKGLLRSYFERNDKETTLWFAWEGDFVIFLSGRNDGVRSLEHIQLIEESILFEINYEMFRDLCDKHPAIDRFYTKFLEDSYLYFENRLLSLQFNTAKERYFDIVKNFPDIAQRLPLNMLASYLGVTKERLSRIRAEKK